MIFHDFDVGGGLPSESMSLSGCKAPSGSMSRRRTRMTNYDIPTRARHDVQPRPAVSKAEGETYPIAFPTAAILDKMYEVAKEKRGEAAQLF